MDRFDLGEMLKKHSGMRIKYEIKKATAEIKNKRELSEGCACSICEDPEPLNTYDSLKEARKHFAGLRSTITELSSPIGKIYRVEEFYIEANKYDKDGEWYSTEGVWDFSPMTINVMNGCDVVRSFNDMMDAENFFELCVRNGEFDPSISFN